MAIERARAQNMPKDNIDRAVKRGTGESKDGNVLEQIYYEGYVGHGVACMIECVTDNRNRAVSDIRHVLSRGGGNMAEAGSVGWQFTRASYFAFPLGNHDQDAIFELAVEAGANDVTFDDGEVEIVGPVEVYKSIGDRLRSAHIQPEEAELRMLPDQEIELSVDATLAVMKTIEGLEDLDDVQNVFSNLKVTEEALAALEAD
jgi:YebC/PmpR family DNA-binding regulatory protein